MKALEYSGLHVQVNSSTRHTRQRVNPACGVHLGQMPCVLLLIMLQIVLFGLV